MAEAKVPLDISELECQSLTACRANDFEVVKVLGAGQCGLVLQVVCIKPHHPAPAGRSYALKLAFNYGHQSTAVHNAYKDEFLVLSSLPRHRNIVRYLVQFVQRLPREWLQYLPEAAQEFAQVVDNRGRAVLDARGFPQLCTMQFILFEYYPRSLEAAIREGSQEADLPPGVLLKWCLDVATGLAHLQQYNVLHRDLKLDNILVANDGRAVICDFGLAAWLTPDMKWKRPLRPGDVVGGNQSHLAPEVLSASLALARGADSVVDYAGQPSFELGVVCYEILLGRHPVTEYDYPSVPEVQGKLVYAEEDVALLDDRLPLDVRTCLRSMCLCDPGTRASVAAAVSALESAVAVSDHAVAAGCAECHQLRQRLATVEAALVATQERALLAEARLNDATEAIRVLQRQVVVAEQTLAAAVAPAQLLASGPMPQPPAVAGPMPHPPAVADPVVPAPIAAAPAPAITSTMAPPPVPVRMAPGASRFLTSVNSVSAPLSPIPAPQAMTVSRAYLCGTIACTR